MEEEKLYRSKTEAYGGRADFLYRNGTLRRITNNPNDEPKNGAWITDIDENDWEEVPEPFCKSKVPVYEIFNKKTGEKMGFFFNESYAKTIETFLNEQINKSESESINIKSAMQMAGYINESNALEYLAQVSLYANEHPNTYGEIHVQTALKIAAGLITLEEALKNKK